MQKEWYDRVIDEQNELCAKIKRLKEALAREEFVDSLEEKAVVLLKEHDMPHARVCAYS